MNPNQSCVSAKEAQEQQKLTKFTAEIVILSSSFKKLFAGNTTIASHIALSNTQSIHWNPGIQ